MLDNKGSVKWIVGLCVAVLVAITGWTVSVMQASKARAYETVISDALALTERVTVHDVEIAVLKTQYSSIERSLEDIIALLQTHMGIK